MSPRLSSGVRAPRLGAGLLLLALLAPAAAAQAPPDEPFTSVVDGNSYLGNSPIRVWHRTRGYGEETAETAFGTHWAMPFAGESIGFIDGQFRIGNNDTDFSLNLGAGYRWRADDFFTGDPRILGFSFWYDGEDTEQDNFFNQLGFSLERLGPAVDLRFNANFPIEDPKDGDDVVLSGATTFFGNQIGQTTLIPTDVPLRVVDFEVAPRILNFNAWVYGGGYQMDGDGVSETGWKAGGRGYVTNDLALDVGVTDDDEFGTNTVVQIIWTPGRTGPTMSSWPHMIEDRMREPVYRNAYVAIDVQTRTGAEAVLDDGGQPFNIVHVNSSAAPGGDGTFERPFDELADVTNETVIGDIILVHANSAFDGENVMIKDSQRFLGEGNNVFHTVATQDLGTINIPETFAGARGQARPIIANAPGQGAILLAGGNDEVNTLDPIEISNFQIDGGTRGVFSPTGVGGVNINQMLVNNTTSHGIELTPLVETLANNSEQVRFQPTIRDSVFNGVGGDDIHIDATTAEPPATPIVEAIVMSDITSDDGEGVGINLINTKRNVTITDFDWDGGTTGLGALRIEDAASTSNVTMNGTNAITGGVTGVAGSGFAIALIDGDGTHNVTGTTITDMGGDSIIANDGVADLNFTGFIEQTANNASILSVTNGHDGNMTFTELVANAGVINATTGDGLQFDDGDGAYTFNDLVTFDGTSAAVNVVNGSAAVITIADGTFTDTTGDTITFAGGTANMTFTGRIEQAVNASVLSVTGGHTGTLAFNERTTGEGVIEATNGDGLQFDDADGAYNFNDLVTLNGTATTTDTGVDVLNDSDGTFAFTEVDIDYENAAGSAVRIDGSVVQSFAMAGDITTEAGRPVELTNNTGGSVAITADITGLAGSNGILIDGNTDLTASLSGDISMNTGALAAITVNNNNDGATTFGQLDLDTTTGDAFNVTNNLNGHTVAVTGTGNTINTGDGDGVTIDNNTNGNTTFADLDVNTTNGTAFTVSDNTGHSVTVNGADTDLITTGGDGLVVNNNTNGATTFASLQTSTGAGDGVTVTNNTNHTVDVNGAATSIVTTGGAGVNIDTNSGGSTTFDSLDLNTGAGNAFRVNNSVGHAVAVAGTDNTITATTGTGISMANATVGAGGINFDSVAVNGAVNGILLTSVAGNAITIGAGAINNGDGGNILNTSGNAIDVSNVASLSLNRMVITGTAAAFDGVEIDHTGAATSTVSISNTQIQNGALGVVYNRTASATSRLTLNNVDISNVASIGIDIDVAGSSDANITINNDTSVQVDDAAAMTVNTSGGAKTLRILVDDSDFSNNSGTTDTVDFIVAGSGTINANVTGNNFTNSGAAPARSFEMTNNGTATINLNLDNNTASSNHPTDDYLLDQNSGTFNVVDLPTIEARNGTVEQQGTINDIPGPVPPPQ